MAILRKSRRHSRNSWRQCSIFAGIGLI